MSLLDEMAVPCPIKRCRARKGKVCKGYDTWERTRDGPSHDARVKRAYARLDKLKAASEKAAKGGA